MTSGASAGMAGVSTCAACFAVVAVGAAASPHAASGWQSAITQPYIQAERHPAVFISKGSLRVRHAPTPESRSEEHTSELQSLMRISYAVFCLKNKKKQDRA